MWGIFYRIGISIILMGEISLPCRQAGAFGE